MRYGYVIVSVQCVYRYTIPYHTIRKPELPVFIVLPGLLNRLIEPIASKTRLSFHRFLFSIFDRFFSAIELRNDLPKHSFRHVQRYK